MGGFFLDLHIRPLAQPRHFIFSLQAVGFFKTATTLPNFPAPARTHLHVTGKAHSSHPWRLPWCKCYYLAWRYSWLWLWALLHLVPCIAPESHVLFGSCSKVQTVAGLRLLVRQSKNAACYAISEFEGGVELFIFYLFKKFTNIHTQHLRNFI